MFVRRLVLSLTLACAMAFSGRALAQAAVPSTCPATYVAPLITQAGNTVLIPANASGRRIVICTLLVHVIQPSSPISFELVTGTGTACATGTRTLVHVTGNGADQSLMLPFGGNAPLIADPSAAVCLYQSGVSTTTDVTVTYGAN